MKWLFCLAWFPIVYCPGEGNIFVTIVAGVDGIECFDIEMWSAHKRAGDFHVEPRTQPPTPSAEIYYSLRVYYHIMYWKEKVPMWSRESGDCTIWMANLPTQTDKPAEAAAELPDIIQLYCRTLQETVQHKEVHMSTTWSILQWK